MTVMCSAVVYFSFQTLLKHFYYDRLLLHVISIFLIFSRVTFSMGRSVKTSDVEFVFHCVSQSMFRQSTLLAGIAIKKTCIFSFILLNFQVSDHMDFLSI